MKSLWQLAYREASTLAYADAFRAIMLAFVIATLLVPLLPNVAGQHCLELHRRRILAES